MFNIPSFIGFKQPAVASGPVYDADYQAILTYAASILTPVPAVLPSDANKLVQNQFVLDLKAAGIWNKLDHLCVYNGPTPCNDVFAVIDWKNPNAVRMSTIIPTVSFVNNQGFQGNGITGYIDSNYNPSTMGQNYLLNSASFGYYMRTIDTTPQDQESGFSSQGSGGRSWVRYGSTTKRAYMNSSSFASYSFFTASSNQLVIASRLNSTQFDLYNNGSLTQTLSVSSTAITNVNFLSFRQVNVYSNCQLGLVFAGGGLTGAEISAFQTAWVAYLTNLVP
jgi:hypothetical protein